MDYTLSYRNLRDEAGQLVHVAGTSYESGVPVSLGNIGTGTIETTGRGEIETSGGFSDPSKVDFSIRRATDNFEIAYQLHDDDDASGSGPNAVSITVTDGTNPLQNASVALSINNVRYTAKSNADGIAEFSLDSGTYKLAVSLVGYQFTPTTVVVDGETEAEAAMTAIIPEPSPDPNKVPVFIDSELFGGAVAPGVKCTLSYLVDNVRVGGKLPSPSSKSTTGETGDDGKLTLYTSPTSEISPAPSSANRGLSHKLVTYKDGVEDTYLLAVPNGGGNVSDMIR